MSKPKKTLHIQFGTLAMSHSMLSAKVSLVGKGEKKGRCSIIMSKQFAM